ncbi:MAG: SAM-dependent methyltransferase [Burkholderiales bacterium]|nr:SAM-dependent methyltransferase [Burkholderiales bacterium]
MRDPHPHFPAPPPEALAASESLSRLIAGEIAAGGGRISFARYMELALYAPGLGYYMAGSRKLGSDGDFVTAPEISPLFGRALARQIAPLIAGGLGQVLEIGAGSGALAADLLLELERLGLPPRCYLILELSADLRARSRDTLAARAPRLLPRVAWLNGLPPAFEGVVVGNEVLDAIPVERIARRGGETLQAWVRVDGAGNRFGEIEAPAAENVRRAAEELPLPADDYRTEIQLAARGFVRSLGTALARGVALFVDYGFPRHEYYHPQRARGTLMCHYRHRAHDDPYFLPGLQDITSHLDFSAIALAARDAGLGLLGYTDQARFLVNCGITDLLAETPPADTARYAPQAAQAQKLLSPAEMGELVKVIALGRGVDAPLAGFARGDRSASLQV